MGQVVSVSCAHNGITIGMLFNSSQLVRQMNMRWARLLWSFILAVPVASN